MLKNNLYKLIYKEKYPIRKILIKLIEKLKIGSYFFRLKIGALNRPYYGNILYEAAKLAKSLGYKKFSVIEFGVAAGGGLIQLEYQAEKIKSIFEIDIEIYGFDNKDGLPPPEDYKDIPYIWEEGEFKMDENFLRNKLKKANLILGDIKDTSKNFFSDFNPPPIGALIFDFDFYSSTVNAFKILENNPENFLPRVYSYFDDIFASEEASINEFTGERLAINEFNQKNEFTKIATSYITNDGYEQWRKKLRTIHFFKHPKYNIKINKK